MNKLLIHTFGKINLDKDGVWHHDNTPFVHEGMSKLFHKSIIRLPDNTYALKINGSQVPIEVEDVISWVSDVDVNVPDSRITLTLTNESNIPLTSQDKLLINNDNELYVIFSDGSKSKFFRNSYIALTRYLAEDNRGFSIVVGNFKLPITQA
jgi:hypothetical protein